MGINLARYTDGVLDTADNSTPIQATRNSSGTVTGITAATRDVVADLGLGSSGASTATTVSTLVALRKAGTLVSGTIYATENGWTYKATSSTHFLALNGAPLLAYGLYTGIGDSIMANQNIGGVSNTMSIINWYSSQIDSPLDMVANRGVGGYALATINSTQVAATVADASEIVWLHGGVNNLRYGYATATSIEQAAIDLKVILDALSPVKQAIVVDSVTPWLWGPNATDGYRSLEIPALNNLMKGLCARYPNVIWNDIYPAILNTASSLSDPDTTCLLDSLIHPNSKGAALLGFQSALNLAGKLYIVPAYSITSTVSLPTFTGTTGTATPGTGTITGSAPDSVAVAVSSGPAAVTLAAKTYTSTLTGLNVIATNAGAASFIGISLNAAGLATALAVFVAGDKVRFTATIRVKSGVLLARVFSYLLINGSIVIANFTVVPAIETPNLMALGSKSWTAKTRTPVYTIPAGMTAINPTVGVQIGASTGAVDFDLIDWKIEKLIAL
jgi:hypothetical protein